MAASKKNTARAVVNDFRIVNRYEGMDPELLAVLQDEMHDLDQDSGIDCRKIKIPSGGGISYEVQGEDEDDTEPMKEISGVIVFTHRLSGYWPGTYGKSGDDGSKPPVCSSIDGKTGINSETGEVRSCEGCPYNEYGTAVDQQGNSSRGKACKNMRRLYILMDGDPNFYLLTVPPTSIKDVNRQLKRIMHGGTPYTGMIVKLKLEKAKNASGVTYSKVAISRSGLLPPETADAINQLRLELKAQYQSMSITADDYTTVSGRGRPSADIYPTDEEAAAMYGIDFEEAPPHDDRDAPLPFA